MAATRAMGVNQTAALLTGLHTTLWLQFLDARGRRSGRMGQHRAA